MAASNVIEIILRATDDASPVLDGALDGLTSGFRSLGESLLDAGLSLGGLTAPLVAGLSLATRQAMSFDESMTNVQAILKASDADIKTLSEDILNLGANSRAGPQATAEAFYEIVSGVSDASTHMAILEQSIATSEAGAADLRGTTSGLIAVMNAYGFSADEAAFASDVMTQTVGAGVLTMDELAGTIGNVTGTANAMGIAFDELGAMFAYLTTQGYSAGQASSFLNQMMLRLQNPGTELKEIIAGLGYESGQAMVDALGLAGAYEAIKEAGGSSFDGIITDSEALRGAIALTNEGAEAFFANFLSGVDGATAAAQDIQMASPAAQFDLLKSSISATTIELGSLFLPMVLTATQAIRPLIGEIREWIGENQPLVDGLGRAVLAAGALATGLVTLGGVFLGISAALGVLVSPVGLIVAALGGLYLAYTENFGGIRTFLDGAVRQLRTGLDFLRLALGWFLDDVESFGLLEAIKAAFGLGGDAESLGQSWIEGLLVNFGLARDQAERFMNVVGPAISAMLDALSSAFSATAEVIRTTLLPDLQIAGQFILNEVIPAVAALAVWLGVQLINGVTLLAGFWETTLLPALVAGWGLLTDQLIPALITFAGWLADHLPTAIQAAAEFWDTTLLPALQAVWAFIQTSVVPALREVAAWLADHLPVAVQAAADFWRSTLQPALSTVWDFIQTSVLPTLQDVVLWLQTHLPLAVQAAADFWRSTLQPALSTVWDFISLQLLPVLSEVVDWLAVNVPLALQTAADFWRHTLQPALSEVWDFISLQLLPVLESVASFLMEAMRVAVLAAAALWTFILQPALQVVWAWFQDKILPILSDAADFLEGRLNDAITLVSDTWNTILYPALQAAWAFIQAAVVPVLDSLTSRLRMVRTPADALALVFDGVKRGIDGIKSAIDTVLGPLDSLTSKLGGIDVPDWLIPGSPTPFELGLRGITNAMNGLNAAAGSAFSPLALQPAPALPLNAPLPLAPQAAQDDRRDRRRTVIEITVQVAGKDATEEAGRQVGRGIVAELQRLGYGEGDF